MEGYFSKSLKNKQKNIFKAIKEYDDYCEKLAPHIIGGLDKNKTAVFKKMVEETTESLIG